MKLSTLHEGFDFNRQGDRAKYVELNGAIEELNKIATNPQHSRRSVLRRLTISLIETVSTITIDSPAEQEDVYDIVDMIDNLEYALLELQDGPIPNTITDQYIIPLIGLLHNFGIKYTKGRHNR